MAWVRRRSSAFSRGRSRFRGVSGQQGRWEARIGTFAGRKNARPALHMASRKCSEGACCLPFLLPACQGCCSFGRAGHLHMTRLHA